MRVGVSSYTWPWAVGRPGYGPEKPLDELSLLERTAGLGISLLQIADTPSLHELDESRVSELSRRAAERGITLEVGTRGIEPEHLLAYLDIARICGSALVRSLTRRLDDEALSWMKEIMPAYESAGISLALENHDEHRTSELAAFIDRVGSPSLGVCLDTVNSFAALENPESVVSTLAPYTLNFHVKDFDVVRAGHELGFSIVGRPAGEGRLDIPRVVQKLRDNGHDPNAILELWTPFTEDLDETIRIEEEWSNRSVTYLRTVIDGGDREEE
jgi:sugar phosphate isomerase/epimerase